MNSKHCLTVEMELFPQVVMVSEANAESCHTSKLELLAKIVRNKKPFTIFAKTPQSWMFGKVLNMLLNWLPKLRTFQF